MAHMITELRGPSPAATQVRDLSKKNARPVVLLGPLSSWSCLRERQVADSSGREAIYKQERQGWQILTTEITWEILGHGGTGRAD